MRLYSAIQEHVLGFKMLHEKCHKPITFQRWCQHCKKEVPWQDIVKGITLDDGSQVVLTKEKLKELHPKTTDTITIIEFVSADQIEPIHIEHNFYLGPEKAGEHAFYLFKKALEKSGKIAIGTFVMRDKQYICAINPYADTLLLSTLHYSYEIRNVQEVPHLGKEPKQFNQAEINLAQKLIDALSVKKLNLTQFKDTFAQQLKEAIRTSKKEKVSARSGKKKKISMHKQVIKKKEKDTSLATALRASLIAPGKRGEIARAKKGR